MNPNAAQYGVIAKRGLPTDLHNSPVPPTRSPMPRHTIFATLTMSPFLPSGWESQICRGLRLTALSPHNPPLAGKSLAMLAGNANSRFFTNCYREARLKHASTSPKKGLVPCVPRNSTGVALHLGSGSLALPR
jgi:hypothetical protein